MTISDKYISEHMYNPTKPSKKDRPKRSALRVMLHIVKGKLAGGSFPLPFPLFPQALPVAFLSVMVPFSSTGFERGSDIGPAGKVTVPPDFEGGGGLLVP